MGTSSHLGRCLRQLTTDEDPDVRRAAAEALTRIRGDVDS